MLVFHMNRTVSDTQELKHVQNNTQLGQQKTKMVGSGLPVESQTAGFGGLSSAKEVSARRATSERIIKHRPLRLPESDRLRSRTQERLHRMYVPKEI